MSLIRAEVTNSVMKDQNRRSPACKKGVLTITQHKSSLNFTVLVSFCSVVGITGCFHSPIKRSIAVIRELRLSVSFHRSLAGISTCVT